MEKMKGAGPLDPVIRMPGGVADGFGKAKTAPSRNVRKHIWGTYILKSESETGVSHSKRVAK